MTYEVYCHTSPSGKRYVGFTRKGWAVRWRNHVAAARRGEDTAFYRALRKYGPESFTHEVLDRVSTQRGAKSAERAWIKHLRSQVDGYNSTSGGDGVPDLPPSVLARVGNRNPRTEAQREAVRRAQLGRVRGPHSPEHAAKISAAMVGKTRSEATRSKVRAANLGKRQSQVTRAKRAAALKGHPVSEKTRQKISRARAAAWARKKGLAE